MVCWTTNCSQLDLVWNTVAYSANTRPRHSNGMEAHFGWSCFLRLTLNGFLSAFIFFRVNEPRIISNESSVQQKNSNLRRFFVRTRRWRRPSARCRWKCWNHHRVRKTRHFLPQSCSAITISTSLSGWHPFCWSRIDAHWFSLNCRNLVESSKATTVSPHLQNKPLADFDWHLYQTHKS